MKEYQIQHPTQPGRSAIYGWSPERGFYASREDSDDHVKSRNLLTVLKAFVSWEFFEYADIQLAHKELVYLMPDEMDDPALATCAHLIVNLRRLANQ